MPIYPPISVNQKIGRWTVLDGPFKNKWGSYHWSCRCDCGTIRLIGAGPLKRKATMSCGCLARELTKARLTDHGGSYTNMYRTWGGILSRCCNPNSKSWKRYGGRGIYVCDRWKESFSNFLADMGDKPPNHQLDRIDNNGPYSPENCRWATPAQNSRNRRNTIILTYNGESLPLSEWAERIGIKHTVLRSRLDDGWSVERMLTEPVRPRTRHKPATSDFETQKFGGNSEGQRNADKADRGQIGCHSQ